MFQSLLLNEKICEVGFFLKYVCYQHSPNFVKIIVSRVLTELSVIIAKNLT